MKKPESELKKEILSKYLDCKARVVEKANNHRRYRRSGLFGESSSETSGEYNSDDSFKMRLPKDRELDPFQIEMKSKLMGVSRMLKVAYKDFRHRRLQLENQFKNG